MTEHIKIFNTAVELLAYHNDDPTTPVVSLSVDLELVMYNGYGELYLTIEPSETGYVCIFVPRELWEDLKISYIAFRFNSDENWYTIQLDNNTPTQIINGSEVAKFTIYTVGSNMVQLKADYIGCDTYDPVQITVYDYTLLLDLSFNVYGNIMSLVYGDNFNQPNTLILLESYLFLELFNSSSIIDASNLILPLLELPESCYDSMFAESTLLYPPRVLPALTLSESCYFAMFEKCINLVVTPELPATTLANKCYYSMFQDCTSLTVAPELQATSLTSHCYYHMFQGCTNLTVAPELPSKTLADYCYASMFRGTSLTTAPELPATILKRSCYNSMFRGCTGLIVTPELPAITLTDYCYNHMFDGCTSLNSITCLATDISATSCTLSWVSGVASSGTFTKAASMTSWSTNVNGIPEGWTVQNAS